MTSKRPSRTAPSRSAATRGVVDQSDWLDGLVTLLTATLFLCRLLTPTEGASVGETLWIVQLTLLALAVWALATYRSGEFIWRPDWIDGAVCLIGIGQLISAAVNQGQADRRAMLNMVWEWCGLVATWFLMRRVAQRPGDRRSLVLGAAALGVVLAGLGLWQHYVDLERTRQEVAQLEREWNKLQSAGRPIDADEAVNWDRAVNELQLEFHARGIPLEGQARALFQQRLQASSEPLGPFALANTFAGILITLLLLWIGFFACMIRAGDSLWKIVAVAFVCGLMAYCVLLTKSRTGYVGLMVGLFVGLFSLRESAIPRRKMLLGGAAIVFGIAVLVAAAALTGGLDRFVVAESWKSLRYRGEYWLGTWRMLTDSVSRLIFGVGPGNFRSYYLEYKLAESSEEIADPHNLFLDVWSGGGLIALAGLGLLITAALRPLWRRFRVNPLHSAPSFDDHPPVGAVLNAVVWKDPVLIGAAVSFGLVYAFGGTSDDRMLPLFVGWSCTVLLGLPFRQFDLPRFWYGAAGLALVVHLLGAGGIAMPGVTETLLVLTALANTDAARTRVWRIQPRPGVLVCGGGAVALYLGCWFTATNPVRTANVELANGDQALMAQGRFDKAEQAYRRAYNADAFDARSCVYLARLSLQRWLATKEGDSELFRQCVEWQNRAIVRQPRDFGNYRSLGDLYLARYDRSHDPADAALAAEEFDRAVALYPNHAELLSELAEALWFANQASQARLFAERALELDEINHRHGHIDKQLSEDRLKVMNDILK